MFSIGEFSKITGLTVKSLRFYHEQRILIPARVESGSGYRYYSDANVETARVIAALRELEFSLADIAQILGEHDDDENILTFLESRRTELQARIKKDRAIVRRLEEIIQREQISEGSMNSGKFEIESKQVDPMLVASLRMRGKYTDCGAGFGRIGRRFGRVVCGKAMMLCHDNEYREDDASFEVAMPIRKGVSRGEIEVRQLPGGPCISLMHLGPYDQLSRSYEQILRYANENGLSYAIPTREVYHKGPGMIFRGNPQKYLTEIQLMLDTGASDEIQDSGVIQESGDQ